MGRSLRWTRGGAVALVASAALVAGCGGGGDDHSDRAPREILRDTFSEKNAIKRGRLDLRVRGNATGGSNAGTFNLKVGGPFESRGKTRLPLFDFDLNVSSTGATSLPSISAGASLVGDRGFIEFGGDAYEVDQTLLGLFEGSIEQGTSTTSSSDQLEQLGLDPERWLTGLRNEGTEEADGDEVIRLSGDLDVKRFFADVKNLPQKLGNLNIPGASQLPSLGDADADEIASVVDTATFDVLTTPDDYQLRGLEADVKLKRPAGESTGPKSVNLNIDLGFSDIGKAQSFEAPTGAKPLGELLGSLGGLGDLGALLGGGASGGDDGSGSGADSGTGTTTTPALPDSDDAQKLLDCMSKAKDAAAVQRCSRNLQ